MQTIHMKVLIPRVCTWPDWLISLERLHKESLKPLLDSKIIFNPQQACINSGPTELPRHFIWRATTIWYSTVIIIYWPEFPKSRSTAAWTFPAVAIKARIFSWVSKKPISWSCDNWVAYNCSGGTEMTKKNKYYMERYKVSHTK